MKKQSKCALGLVATALSIVALGGCSKVYESNVGAYVTYTDAQGNRVSYTAEELFGSYRDSSSSLTTEFDKVYEVLVRKYYESPALASELASCKATATQNVEADKQTARKNSTNNGTSYETEWESILDSHSVDNVDELYEYYLYQAESEDFSNEVNLTFRTGNSGINGYEAMRDGQYTEPGQSTPTEAFPASDWGRKNEGYLKEMMPYHVRHILVKNSGSDKEYAQDKITETEANKVATVMTKIAGATINGDGANKTLDRDPNPMTFGMIANDNSEDTSSATAFGEGEIMTKESGLINEYKLGIYAYESLYNERSNEFVDANRIKPGVIYEDADDTPVIDESLELTDRRFGLAANDYKVTVADFFYEQGIGEIPFGAAMALSDYADVDDGDINKAPVNEGNDTFLPRNIIWNKYFNKHQICVITPNAIESNATNAEYEIGVWANDSTNTAALAATNELIDGANIEENWKGEYSEQFGSLPGFSRDTTNVLPQFEHNVLTNSEGQIVLAVRGGSGTSYQGIFFIVIQRSALSQYGLIESDGQWVEATESAKGDDGVYTEDRADLNDYYNVYIPSESSYPTVTGGAKLSTLINYNRQSTSDLNDKRDSLVSAISSYNADLNTYNFQWLVEKDALKFNNDNNLDLEATLKNYSTTKREATANSKYDTWSNAWLEYAESISAQEAARNEYSYADGIATPITDRTGYLITERGAIEYLIPDDQKSEIWNVGGACYYATV